jgi:hypothetical protein
MNPFEQMSKTLAHRQPVTLVWQSGLAPKSQSRVGTIRDLLKSEARPMSAAEIAYDVDLPSFNQNLVWLLLKYDIQKGRVLFSGGMYAWNAEFDTAEAGAIRKAIKLLKKSGYTVTKGGVA